MLSRYERLRLQNLKPGNWYSIKNLSSDETELLIYDEISFYGVSAGQFTKDLAEIGTPNLTVRLNSPGGDVFDGIAIYNALRQHPAHVTTKVDSLAASIASVIAQAGDKRVMMPKGQMMIHEASGLMVGNAEEMMNFAALLDKQSELIASIYAERSGSKSTEFRDLMKAETWLSDQETVDLGLADAIADVPAKVKDEPKAEAKVDWMQLFAKAEANSLGVFN